MSLVSIEGLGSEFMLRSRLFRSVTQEELARARNGDFDIILTPTKPVPRSWLSDVKNKKVLCLVSGGGRLAPLLAAAGADVTVLDSSPKQIEKDLLIANREKLRIRTLLGSMNDIRAFGDDEFDFIVNPVTNSFVPEIRSVWSECFRILRPGGVLISGFNNPIAYIFDRDLLKEGRLQLRYSVPFSELTSFSEEENQKFVTPDKPAEFGHSLTDQIGGQLDAGFLIAGFYEDIWGDGNIVDRHFPQFLVTRSIKLAH